jgi:dipeptidase E
VVPKIPKRGDKAKKRARRWLLLHPEGLLSPGAWTDEAQATAAHMLKRSRRAVVIPYGVAGDYDRYTEEINALLKTIGKEARGIHTFKNPETAISKADAIIVLEGNSFLLKKELEDRGLIKAIQRRVARGVPYVGSGAGSEVAGLSIRTTNDLPVVATKSLDGLKLVQLQITATGVGPDHSQAGETTHGRLAEFVATNDVPVVVVGERSWLRVSNRPPVLEGDGGGMVVYRDRPIQALESGEDLDGITHVRPRFDRSLTGKKLTRSRFSFARGSTLRRATIRALLVAEAIAIPAAFVAAPSLFWDGSFHYHGGPVEHHPRIRLIYWGKSWENGNAAIKRAINQFFRVLPGSNYQQILTQYYDTHGHVGNDPHLVGTITDATSPNTTITSTQVETEIQKIARLDNLPAGIDEQYIVFGDPTAKTNDHANSDCGYHSYVTVGGKTYVYVFIPYPGRANCGNGKADSIYDVNEITNAVSHEYDEAVTDPTVRGWYSMNYWKKIQFWDHENKYIEAGDKCNSTQGSIGETDLRPQQLWDMSTGTCTSVKPRPVHDSITLDPISQGGRIVADRIQSTIKFPDAVRLEEARVVIKAEGYDLRRVRFALPKSCHETYVAGGGNRRASEADFVCFNAKGVLQIAGTAKRNSATKQDCQVVAVYPLLFAGNGQPVSVTNGLNRENGLVYVQAQSQRGAPTPKCL